MADIDVQIAVVRAAVAHTIAEREGMPIARPALATAGPPDDLHLTLLGYGSFGWPMGDELLPLARLMRGVHETVSGERRNGDSGDAASDEGLTTFDVKLDEISAFLHDHLLNVAPPFAVETPSPTDMPTLNGAYERALRRGEFAGTVGSDAPEVEAARALLFAEDAQGVPLKSEVLKRYEEYEAEVEDLTLKAAELESQGKSTQAARLRMRLTRVQVEWQALGRRSDVEQALRTLREGDADAGFEDERTRFLNILEARRTDRLGSGLSYLSATMAPLSPLFADDADPNWSVIELDKDAVQRAIGASTRAAFGLNLDELERGTDGLESVRFSYTVCTLDREWLREEFLRARYWRLPSDEPVLSDGRGGGALPTIPSRVIFIRGVGAKFADGGTRLVVPDESEVQGAERSVVDVAIRPQFELLPLLRELQTVTPSVQTASKQFLRPVLDVANHELEEREQTRAVGRLDVRPGGLGQRRQFLVSNGGVGGERPELPPNVLLKKAASPQVSPQLLQVLTFPEHLSTVLEPNAGQDALDRPEAPQHRENDASGDAESVSIQGRVRGEGAPQVLTQLTVTTELLGHPEREERAVRLSRVGANLLQFTVTADRMVSIVHRRQGRMQHKRVALDGVRIRLRDVDGHVLGERTVDFSTEQAQIDWTVAAENVTLSLASAATPSLFGYGIRVVPPAPDPDTSLTWEE